MLSFVQKIQHFVDNIVSSSPIKNQQQLVQLNHYIWLSFLALHVTIFGIFYSFYAQNYVLSLLLVIYAIVIISTLYMIPRIKAVYLLHLVTSLIFLAIIIYMIYNATLQDSSKILWTYLFPMGAIFLFGNRKGFIFSIIVLMAISVIFIFSHHLDTIYSTPFKIRFALTYCAVALMTSWIEYYRHRYQEESIQIQQALLEEQNHLKEEIQRRIILEKKLTHLTQTDSLTKVYNRHYFWESANKELKRSLRYGVPMCLAILDIDSFKSINDKYGHPMGDTVLRTLSSYCSKAIRENDIFARIGGEEFAFLLLHTNLQDAHEKMDSIRQEIEKIAITLENNEIFYFTVSIGITALSKDFSTLEHLYKSADEHLYLAKNSGRNCVR